MKRFVQGDTPLPDAVLLARIQFAFTAMFHMIWPLLTIGLSLYLFVAEALWLRTGDEGWYRQARFWGRLFLLNFGVGVATGIPMEFQFGTNWARFAVGVGGFFGDMLGFEAAMAFMLESAFLGIMAFGWNRVPRGAHLFATGMVALASSLSALWIMMANSWMHTPSGGTFEGGRFVVQNYLVALLNPDVPWSFSHMWVACLETTIFTVGGVSAWHLARGRHVDFYARAFKAALAAAVVAVPLQVLLGDQSGLAVAEYQPSKLGALEAHWETNPPGKGAAWRILAWPNPVQQKNDWAIEVPNVLSLLATHSLTGQLKGLREFPRADQPPIALPFYAFRTMIAVGFGLVALLAWSLLAWRRGDLHGARLQGQRRLLGAWVLAAPLTFLAVETGWIVREVGRQPWIIYGVVRTSEATSPVPASAVGFSLAVYVVVYGLLFAAFAVFAGRILREGPDSVPGPPSAAVVIRSRS